ncbi:hypothetical protein H9P43_005538 [Blastocladiella emersonii ATCC 22665]|nr:hypothetical protein H9P43_005538 [Blastocladiella emersonii ATCC 22665]
MEPTASAAAASEPAPKFSVLDTRALEAALAEAGVKAVPHAENIQRHLVLTAAASPDVDPDTLDWAAVPNLPKRAVALLRDRAALATEVAETTHSADGNTTKLLVRLRRSGALIETVVMHYDRLNTHVDPSQEPGPVATILNEDDDEASGSAPATPTTVTAPKQTKRNLKPRTAVCISSQVGCKMACSFCATGTMGFKAHLTPAEIAEQVFHANRVRKVNSVICMGMGEGFDNYDNLVAAIRCMTNRRLFGLGESSICVSTVGVVSKMRQITVDLPNVKLALSLHAPNQRLRNEIVPSAKVYPLDRLMDAVDEYLTRQKRIMIEYILIRNINVAPETAHELGELLKDRSVILNLIPYNPTDTGKRYEAPTPEEIDEFDRILRVEYKVRTTVRRTMGQDIDGACGQLVVNALRNEIDKPDDGCGSSTSPAAGQDMEDLLAAGKSVAAGAAVKRGRVTRRIIEVEPETTAEEEVAAADPTPAAADEESPREPASGSSSGEPSPTDWIPTALIALGGVLVARLAWKLVTRRRR